MRRITMLAILSAMALQACHEIEGEGGADAADVVAGETVTPRIDDDFCHGLADGTLCDDGNPCTADDRCGLGVCMGRAADEGSACEDGDPCTVDDLCVIPAVGGPSGPNASATIQCVGTPRDCTDLDGPCSLGTCHPDTGACEPLFTEEGAECDDGDLCTLEDACEPPVGGPSGPNDLLECVGTPLDCSGLDASCATGACDQETGDCVAQPFEVGAACDDGDLCTHDDACEPPVGGPSGPTADLPTCVGTPLDCGSLGDQCSVGECDPETGECVIIDLGPEDGTECTDEDACTVDDHCEAGDCVGAPVDMDCAALDGPCQAGACDPDTGACAAALFDDGTPCDDGDACTEDGLCEVGLCVSTPVDLDCSGLDDGCNTGQCHPDSGECVAVPVADGTGCDDWDPCTLEDGCFMGACAGEIKDCSMLDAPCVSGVCEPDTGACGFQTHPDGAPCDDGDACTGGDACDAGSCVGGEEICSICEVLPPGEPCDDANPCTTDEVCGMVEGEPTCLGVLVDCSGVADACNDGACDPSDGQCIQVPLPDGLPCDDADACTHSDACAGGTCAGSPLPTCGEEVTACEPMTAENDLVGGAVPVALTGGAATVLGLVSPAMEKDWYAVELLAGQLLTAGTRANCLHDVDTMIEVFAPDGQTLLAADDEGGEGPFSLIGDLEIGQDGVHYVAVTIASDGQSQDYLLDLSAAFPPPCQSDADCACPGAFTCVLEGEDAGLCVPKYGAEIEPDDAPAAATALVPGAPLIAEISDPGDADWFAVQLSADAPYSFQTLPYCDEAVDLDLTLFDPAASAQLAYDADGGGGGHALIPLWVAPEDGAYLLRVRGQNLSTGGYLVLVESAACQVDADCGCVDQVCGAGGLCQPALSVPEGDGAPVPLAPGVHAQSAIDAPYDEDDWLVELAAGVSYDLETLSYCGASLDTKLELLDPGGATVATDDDGGEAFFAAVTGFVPGETGTFTLRIEAKGPGTGDYVVRFQPTPEEE